MAKKDGASKRLAALIAYEKQLKREPTFDDLVAELNEPVDVIRGKVADRVLQIEPDAWWAKPLRAAFTAFNGDPKDPFEWRQLLICFADAHFGRGEPGSPKRWTDERLCQLLADVAAAKAAHPNATDANICRCLIKKGGKTVYGNVRDVTLRRKLQDARNPALNRQLAIIVEGQMMAADIARTEADEKRTRAELLKRVIRDADKRWSVSRK
jgi:hypothetical protein